MAENPSVFRFGDVEVDLIKRQVRKGDAEVHLTALEYRLLSTMISNAERVLTHRETSARSVGTVVRFARALRSRTHGQFASQLEDDPAQPKHLLTETAVGYRLVP